MLAYLDQPVHQLYKALEFEMPTICPLPHALSALFNQVTSTGRITLADRYGLMATLLDETTSVEELQLIDRLFYSMRRGDVKVVEDLSALQ